MEENVKDIRNDRHKSRVEKLQATQIIYNLVSSQNYSNKNVSIILKTNL